MMTGLETVVVGRDSAGIILQAVNSNLSDYTYPDKLCPAVGRAMRALGAKARIARPTAYENLGRTGRDQRAPP
jgi:hypothetical protein